MRRFTMASSTISTYGRADFLTRTGVEGVLAPPGWLALMTTAVEPGEKWNALFRLPVLCCVGGECCPVPGVCGVSEGERRLELDWPRLDNCAGREVSESDIDATRDTCSLVAGSGERTTLLLLMPGVRVADATLGGRGMDGGPTLRPNTRRKCSDCERAVGGNSSASWNGVSPTSGAVWRGGTMVTAGGGTMGEEGMISGRAAGASAGGDASTADEEGEDAGPRAAGACRVEVASGLFGVWPPSDSTSVLRKFVALCGALSNTSCGVC